MQMIITFYTKTAILNITFRTDKDCYLIDSALFKPLAKEIRKNFNFFAQVMLLLVLH